MSESTTASGSQNVAASTEQNKTLTRELLGSLPKSVQGPGFDPAAVSPGILHFGAGNFALAHLGSFVNDVLELDPSWGIVATSLRSDSMVTALRKQDGLYIMVERENDERNARVMAPVVEAVFAPEDPAVIIDYVADPRIKLVTITVSNAGYCLSANGNLNLSHPDIVHDLAEPEVPKTIYGYLVQGLAKRKETGKPLTIMSLDNVESNSRALKAGLLEFVKQNHKDLVEWCEQNVAFPVTLVDRITPATTSDLRDEAGEFLGFDSTVIVGTEKFRQLVVEASPYPLPAWNDFGVETVDDCAGYWQRKFFGLNTAHQVVAIPSLRLAVTYIHEAMGKESIRGLVELAHSEFATFLPGDKADLAVYGEAVRRRFSDKSLNDTVQRVSARTTSKVAERILASVERALASTGKVLKAPTFVTAVWLLNLGLEDEFGQEINMTDSDAEKLLDPYEEVIAWARAHEDNPDQAPLDAVRSALKKIGEILANARFSRLSTNETFVKELAWSILTIHTQGTEKAIEALLTKEQKPMVKTILLDCDDTLVESEKLAFEACCGLVNEVLAGQGVEKRFDPEELKTAFVGCNFRSMVTRLAAEHGFELEADELERLVVEEENRVIAKLSDAVVAAEGVNDALTAVSGKYAMAVVSSSALRRVRACLEKAGQSGFFAQEHVFSAANSLPKPTSKPDPAVYLHALEVLGVDAADCVAVEDSTSGVRSSVGAGIKVIGYVGCFPKEKQVERAEALVEAGAVCVMYDWAKFEETLASL